MMHTLQRLRPLLLFAVSFLLFSCQQDDVSLHQGDGETNSRIISLKDLESKPGAMEKISPYLPHDSRAKDYFPDRGFTVNTDKILLYSDSNIETLTFTVVLDEDRGYIENLILNKETDGTYSVYYAVYNLTEKEREDAFNEEYVDIKGKVYITPYEFDPTSLQKGELIRKDGKCYLRELVRVRTISRIQGQREFSEFKVITTEIPCPGAAEEDDDLTVIENPNNGRGAPNPVFDPEVPDKRPVTPSNPAIGSTRNNFTTTPYIDITEDIENRRKKRECKKVADAMNIPGARQQISELATKANDPANEHGFALTSVGMTLPSTPGPELKVPFIPTIGLLKVIIVSHTHNADPDGKLSVFSFSDLVAFAELLAQEKINEETFVATLSTAKGTHYALTISNVAKFKDFFYHKFHTFGNLDETDKQIYNIKHQKVLKLETMYYNSDIALIKQQNVNNNQMLKEFLKFINEADLGITLFETDATFQEFTTLKLNSNNTIDRTSKCE